MELTTLLVTLFSILMPVKSWYRPDEPLLVKVDAKQPVNLVAIDIQGKSANSSERPTLVEPGQTIDVKQFFPAMQVGTYLLYAVPPSKTTAEFVGTPLVLEFRSDDRPGAPPGAVVIKVEPAVLAQFDTTAGPMTLAFYYGAAPNTVDNFISLVNGGFYDGLTFHRVIPGFIAQTGDPLGNSQGGPGYTIPAEFNDELHREGVVSMAHEGDPLERTGVPPRVEYANTAGSQFFFCLDYSRTKQLNRKYTAFGRVVSGMETLQKIGAGEVADPNTGTPKNPVVINKVRIVPVTVGNDPYPTLMTGVESVEQNPTTVPAAPVAPAVP
ncbi:MAG: peptidylprolyl isomerase [Tepidisphaeraceae bacterium]